MTAKAQPTQYRRYGNLITKDAGPGLGAALAARFSGPGGYYLSGNLLGLAMGIVLQMEPAAEHGMALDKAAEAAVVFLAGSSGAAALTLASLVFMASSEAYHRAWRQRGSPDPQLNRLGDLLSGIGALVLGGGLLMLGQPMLAATSVLLHAAGKFGNAACPQGAALPGWPRHWPDPFRAAVLASRLPATVAALAALGSAASVVQAGGSWWALGGPVTLLACYLLWARADLLLFRSPAACRLTGGTR